MGEEAERWERLLGCFGDGEALERLVEECGTPSEAESLRLLRRLAWARLLGVIRGSPITDWPSQLQKHRQRFRELDEQHKSELDVRKFDANIANPLSRNTANPFLKIQANEELSQEIWKDVERTYPEVPCLTTTESRKTMQRVLFHWCRANNPSKDASESYRQGMNELVAVLFYVVKEGEYVDSGGSSSIAEELCGREHSEADTFMLFEALMEFGLRDMFAVERSAMVFAGQRAPMATPADILSELPRTRAGVPDTKGPQSALLARCAHIFDVLLAAGDPQLYKHLKARGVAPQLFLLRWLRLMFCREFELQDTVRLWDQIFLDAYRAPGSGKYCYNGTGRFVETASRASAALPLVDFICVAMVHSIRSELLVSDENEVLQRLIGFETDKEGPSFCNVARRLRSGGEAPLPALAPVEAGSGGRGLLDLDATAGQQGKGLEALESFVNRPQTATWGAKDPLAVAASPLPPNPIAKAPVVVSNSSGGLGGLGGLGCGGYSGGSCGVGMGAGTLQTVASTAASAAAAAAAAAAAVVGGSSASQVVELQKRLKEAEVKIEHLKKKASEFVKLKEAEWTSKNQELEAKVQRLERDLYEERRQRTIAQAQVQSLQESLAHSDQRFAAYAQATNSAVTLEEDDFGARDSDFGLSDRQMAKVSQTMVPEAPPSSAPDVEIAAPHSFPIEVQNLLPVSAAEADEEYI